MKIEDGFSDDAVLEELGRRITRYRLNINMSQETLAEEAGISLRTLVRIEHGKTSQITNFIRVLRVLRGLQSFEALLPEPALSPVQQLKQQGKKRRRASTPHDAKEPEAEEPWTWGDEE